MYDASRYYALTCERGGVKIEHGGAEFEFVQLARALRERIESGEFPAGAKMPPIAQIVAETGLSPDTIRRAYTVLRDEGLVTVVPGRGTFVRDPS